MNCHDAAEQLPAWAAGYIGPDLLADVENHLRTCESCRDEAAAIRSMLDLLDVDVPSERLRQGFGLRIEPERRELSKRRARKWLTAAVAAAGLLIVLLLPLRRQLSQPEPPVSVPRAEDIRPDRVRQIQRLESAPDRESTEALLITLEDDPNPAVRVAALDSLVRVSGEDYLRKRLSHALLTEESPLVREALTSVIEEMQ